MFLGLGLITKGPVALLLQGAVLAREYFKDEAITAAVNRIYARIDWRWAQPRPPTIALGGFLLAAADFPALIAIKIKLLFEIAPETAAARLSGARVPDKFESQPVEFFRRVSEGYRQRMLAFPNRFARIHADSTREAVWLDVLQAVQRRGWLA